MTQTTLGQYNLHEELGHGGFATAPRYASVGENSASAHESHFDRLDAPLAVWKFLVSGDASTNYGWILIRRNWQE